MSASLLSIHSQSNPSFASTVNTVISQVARGKKRRGKKEKKNKKKREREMEARKYPYKNNFNDKLKEKHINDNLNVDKMTNVQLSELTEETS